ncbi:MAG: 2-succinylbenzoate--CoA ligase [bacterium]|nr:2-succinylbenzoate--CoA ligase [bacterium]
MVASSHNTDWLARSASRNPRATALVDDDRTRLSYAELDALADEAAERLAGSGIGAGDATLLGVGSVDRFLVARLWAAWRVGATPLVIDQTSPSIAQWGSTLREMWKHGPTGTESSPLHTVLLTSGSSRQPLPVRLTHANVAAAVQSSHLRLGNSVHDRWLLTLPLFHIGGLSILWRSAAAGGAVVIHQKFDADRVAAAFKDGLVTVASLVPTMLYRVLDADSGPYPGMLGVLLGGAAAGRELVERALDAGLPVLQTYGMTEACSQIATVVPGEARDSLGTNGRPLDGVEIATGGAGVGEIVVSGPAVSPGYLGRPDRVGGHNTGDIGYLDENGRLVVIGRADDMVITGGENVYPTRIAEVLGRHREVDQVEVVGMPDPEWGQTLVAIIVGDVAARGRIEAWVQQDLPRHEIPKRWAFVDALPLQAGGKVDRTALYDIARSAQ